MKVISFIVGFVLIGSVSAFADETAGRFFLEGDGIVKLRNMKTGAKKTITYRDREGHYPDEVQMDLKKVFGVKKQDPLDEVSLRLVSLLDYIQDHFGEGFKEIRMNSPYRSPTYNQSLRAQGRTVAKASLHTEGMAADIEIPGVDGHAMWLALREKDCCGVGWYGADTVHVDVGPARFWTQSTSKVRTDVSDNNKRIAIWTDRDIYFTDETVSLALTGITLYPFGVNRIADLRRHATNRIVQRVKVKYPLELSDDGKCIMVKDRRAARDLRVEFPAELKGDDKSYHLKLFFCNRPHRDMPLAADSNRILIKKEPELVPELPDFIYNLTRQND